MAKNQKHGKQRGKPEKIIRREKEAEKEAALQKRIDEFDPKTDESGISQFDDLPLHEPILKGLKEGSFTTMTDVQKKTIPIALKGEDIMATAKTGSGKTLAFLIPTIESLVRNNITEFDGLAALIVSPTRELAVQIFGVLKKIGKYSGLSAGLVTGGKDLKYEKDRVGKMNILVGTPGRISQHLNEAIGMETSNLQVLVLDEADRCLDMGFKKQIDGIISHLPPTRQTLLFSATQTESVQDLARLSLTNPQRIGISSDSELSATPESLEQFYIKINLDDKLDVLWSFIKSHLKSKIIVFFSSSKQVQYAYESFRTLQPGISLLKLYGRHKQTSRLETVVKFSQAQYACLFATDIVARGLDFPAVDWVIQVDCPEDAATYVHRVGRAARFGRQGKALLMLLPTEETGFIKRLSLHKIEPKYMNIKQGNKKSIKPQLQSLCFKDPILKNLAQRAFISYYRSVYIQKDKDIFKVDELPSEKFAAALGLPGAPKIKIKGGTAGKDKKNASRQLLELEKANEDGEVVDGKDKKLRTKYDRMFERQNQTVLSKEFMNMTGSAAVEDESDDEFMKVTRADHKLTDIQLPDLTIPTSKRSAKKALSKKLFSSTHGTSTKLKFDDDGVPHPIYELEGEEDFAKAGDAKAQKDDFVSREKEIMSQADVEDKATAKEKRQEKKRKRKEAEKQEFDEDSESDADTQLATGNLDKDLVSSEDEVEDPRSKRPKWFDNEKHIRKTNDNLVEITAPETIEDLESLTARLLQG